MPSRVFEPSRPRAAQQTNLLHVGLVGCEEMGRYHFEGQESHEFDLAIGLLDDDLVQDFTAGMIMRLYSSSQ